MKSRVVIVSCALLAARLCQTSEDVGGNFGIRDGRLQVMIPDDPFEEHIPNVSQIGRYKDFMNDIGSGLPSIQTPFQLIPNPNQLSPNLSQPSHNPIQLSPNSNQLSPNLNQLNQNPNQLRPNTNQLILNPNQQSSNLYQLSPNPNLFLPPALPSTNCGDLQCPRTRFVCQKDVCLYPVEFDDLILRCRSSLQYGEYQFQSIADLLLTVSGRMVREGVSIKILDAKSLLESAKATLAEVVDNIVSLEQFLTDDVIGQVAEDILVDMESLQKTLKILVEVLIETNQGGEVKIPPPVYDRTFRPNDWAPQCSGRWPCTRIFIYPTRFSYAQQRPGCGCQNGARMPQEFMYQQPTPVFRQVMPMRQVVQPQPLFAQPPQVHAQPQYQTVSYQTTLPVPERTSPLSNGVFSSFLTKKMMGKIEEAIAQPQPQQFIAQSNAQPIYVKPPYPVLKTVFATPITRNLPHPTQQSFVYAQPQYQGVNQYRPGADYSSVGETMPVIDDDPIFDAQPYMQFPQKPKFVQGLQITTQLPIYAPQPYTNVNQYRATVQPLLPSNEIDVSMVKRLDNSTNSQQRFPFLGSQPQQSFVQTQQQHFTQPQYPAVIQYQPARYTTGSRSVPTSAVFNESLVKIQDNSTYSHQPFVDPQQLGLAKTQQHQFSPLPQYSKLQIQYQPAKYISGSRSLLNNEPQ